MVYRVLADLALALHLAFVAFVLGGLLVLRWRRVAWLHVPAAAYGVLIEMVGWTCPLTPIENHFRRLGGEAGYQESFVERYIVSLIYPGGLTRTGFMLLGLAVLVINLVIYGFVWRRARRAAALPGIAALLLLPAFALPAGCDHGSTPSSSNTQERDSAGVRIVEHAVVPRRLSVHRIARDHVLGVMLDSLDVPYVQVRRIHRTPAP